MNKDELLKLDGKEKLPEIIKFGSVKFSTVGETLYNILNVEKLDNFDPIFKIGIESQKYCVRKC